MGINLNNNQNSFGKLTTANLNQAKATKNAGNIADAKASSAAKEANSLNSATLKANQGLKIDTNNFGKTDIMPVEEQKTKECKTDIRDEKLKIGNIGKKIMNSMTAEMQNDKTGDNAGANSIVYFIGLILDKCGI